MVTAIMDHNKPVSGGIVKGTSMQIVHAAGEMVPVAKTSVMLLLCAVQDINHNVDIILPSKTAWTVAMISFSATIGQVFQFPGCFEGYNMQYSYSDTWIVLTIHNLEYYDVR